jgi:predicted glycosyltransferase
MVPETALDGPNLLYYADLVISGGGTMNREAAVLGTPTYSLFKGKLAAVDRYLMDKGRMRHIGSIEEIASIPVCKKKRQKRVMNSKKMVHQIVRFILADAEEAKWASEPIISTPRP